MKRLRTAISATFLAFLAAGENSGVAQESASAPSADGESATASAPPPSKEQIAMLVEDLNQDAYKVRIRAQKRLLELGKQHPLPMMDILAPAYFAADAAGDEELRYRLRMTLWNLQRYALQDHPIGFVGIQMRTTQTTDGKGRWRSAVQIQSVIPGTAAERHGLLPGDLILSVDGEAFENEDPSIAFKKYIQGHTVGEEVTLHMQRRRQPISIKLALGKWDETLLGPNEDQRDSAQRAFNGFLKEQAIKLGLAPEPSEAEEARPDGPPIPARPSAPNVPRNRGGQ